MLYKQPDQDQEAPPATGYPPYHAVSNTRPMQPMTDKVPSAPVPAAPQYPYGPWSNAAWPQSTFVGPQMNGFQQTAMGPQPNDPQPPFAPPPPKRRRARTGAIIALTCLLAVVFGVGLFSGWTFAHPASGGALSPITSSSTGTGIIQSASQAAQVAAIAKVEPQVVQIQGTLPQAVSVGSGIIIDNNGDIVTNNHVISGATSLTVTLSNGKSVMATVVGTAPANDLAVIHIQPFANMSVATLGDSSQLTVGQEVLAIGSPLGYSGTATTGVVSALNRSAQEPQGAKLTGMIQTSAAINPGNSGGALINLQGQVIGIPTLSAVDTQTHTPAIGIGFAIPSNQVRTAVSQILGHSI